MAHHVEAGSGRHPTTNPAQLDRLADALLAQGQHQQAERLAHAAAAFRRASVLEPRKALAALVGEVLA